MTNNRVPYSLLTDEEKAALHEHEKAGGEFKYWCGEWAQVKPSWYYNMTYRTVLLPAQRSEQSSSKTQDVIAWDRLPDWVEWVAKTQDNQLWAYPENPTLCTDGWCCRGRRIDDFPGIVFPGTCDWTESKQQRPK
jgi:hypothetical protein